MFNSSPKIVYTLDVIAVNFIKLVLFFLQMYAIVEFSVDNTVALVPLSWIDSDFGSVAIPTFVQWKLDRLVKQAAPMQRDWTEYSCTILKRCGKSSIHTIDLFILPKLSIIVYLQL